MQRQSTLYLVALSLALGATPAVFGDGPPSPRFDYPGAASAQASGTAPSPRLRSVVGHAQTWTDCFPRAAISSAVR
jgi:hypothetical protein